MKPIEPGCLVVVVGGRDANGSRRSIGTNFIVGNLEEPDGSECMCCGTVDRFWEPESGPHLGYAAFCECCLMRIDSDPDEVVEEEEMLV